MRHEPRDQTAEPRTEPDVDEALHHDLAGQRARQRRILAGGQQCHGEECACECSAQHWRQQHVGVVDIGHAGMLGAIERRSGRD